MSAASPATRDIAKTHLYWTTKGDGPDILCLHGFTDHAASYDLIAPLLTGYRLLVPDLPGHGASPPVDPVTVETIIDVVDADLEAMGRRPRFIIGHSMGSVLAASMAARWQARGLEGVVLIASALRPVPPEQIWRAIMALEDPVRLEGTDLETWHDCRQPVDDDFIAVMKAKAKQMAASQWKLYLAALQTCDLSAVIPAIACPVFILHGEDDEIFAVENVTNLSRLARQADVQVLPEIGHNPHWEAPRETAHLIARFLEACSREAAQQV